MTLLKLRSVPFILIEDDEDKNTIPLLIELTQSVSHSVQMFCYEQPVSLWKTVFRNNKNNIYHDEFASDKFSEYVQEKSTVIIDSVYQMALTLGWYESLNIIKRLNSHENIVQLILILHRDCLKSTCKIQSHLNHLANAIMSYNKDGSKISIVIKKSGKIIRSNETLHYDTSSSCLKLIPVVNNKEIVQNEQVQVNPSKLSTFKIEVAQLEMLEKNKLELPYMSKINYGESKVYYEPDAVDDWDEEDPDEDLDI